MCIRDRSNAIMGERRASERKARGHFEIGSGISKARAPSVTSSDPTANEAVRPEQAPIEQSIERLTACRPERRRSRFECTLECAVCVDGLFHQAREASGISGRTPPILPVFPARAAPLRWHGGNLELLDKA